jgi:hypothetical protein
MSGQGSPTIPPALFHERRRTSRSTLVAASTGTAAADAARSGSRRSAATRVVSRKGGGRPAEPMTQPGAGKRVLHPFRSLETDRRH